MAVLQEQKANLSRRLEEKLLSSVFFRVIIALLLTIYLSREFTTPLSKFAEHIRTFSDGDFDERVEMKGLVNINDEVGLLARNFESLQEHIVDSIDKLQSERRIAEDASQAKSFFLPI